MRFANYRGAQINLRPLFFEVPQQDPDPLFVGRSWLFREMEAVISSESPSSANRGIVLSGNVGAGKTAAVLQMVDYSCFGRKREEGIYQGTSHFFCTTDDYETLQNDAGAQTTSRS